MIDRYTRPEMGQIWTLENRYRAWLEVELAVCEGWAELGRIPAEAVEVIRRKAVIDVDRIQEIEQTTRHDVIAFLTSIELVQLVHVQHKLTFRIKYEFKWFGRWVDIIAPEKTFAVF